ncbi:Fumarate reductase flavoprotein subunit precursor [uncultured Clostridium sp.]|uniref:FAD-binding protein n=1 Tax=uncultured Clostridium sp. TaxID=59620 RepID=UPI000823186A|nr:FAD-binding protein [uncultured Clostridium sp.]SCJ32737.1 Fumarate reductase flavoprotein subunit precursor [uncultured Clostridium sp.]
MKKIICLVTMASLLLAGCSTTNEGAKTSQGTGHGYGGEIKVELSTEDGKITGINVVSNHETSVVYDRALPILTERIIEAQSPVVDSVSGATFTSFGVKKAVAEAMKEAGIGEYEISFDTQGPEVEKKDLEEVKTQLVVVGGGPAGLSAAIEAKENGIKDVIVIEKLDILSGNGKFDMNFYDLINSEAQKANGIEDSAEALVADLKADGAWDTDERLMAQAEGEMELDQWLRGMGINLNYNYGGRGHMAEADAYAGEHIQAKMEEKVNDLGIDVRTGTKGLDLIMEDGKATGVKVECKEGTYDIKADAVIMATGGFSNNKELLAKYAPGTERLETSNQMGTTGDFIPVFEANNLKLEKMDTIRIFPNIISGRRDLTGGGSTIYVNKNGERFIDETKGGLTLGNAVLDQEGGAFYIYDQDLYEKSYRLQKHNNLGYHVQADTLEELAGKLGINAENLVKTVETTNKAVDGEIADPFREKALGDKIDKGPYYGVKFEAGVHMTKGGVAANEKAEVLNNDDQVVEGLYAAGEVANSSAAYSASVVFGRISGEEAAKYILNK